MRVAVDSVDYLKDLAAAIERWEITTPIEVLVELNINHNRCGETIGEAVEIARVAKHIEMSTGSILFVGVTGYEGHTPILPPEEKTKQTLISHQLLADAKAKIEAEGIEVKVVSGGGSCNYIDCLNANILTEIQAGGGAICDLLYHRKANLGDHGHKIGTLVLSQIISVPKDKSRAVSNAGFKSIGWHPFGGLPEPKDRKDLVVVGLSAEHTRFQGVGLEKSTTDESVRGLTNVERGEKIILIPGYTDAMGFLHKEIYGIRNNHVEYVWKTCSTESWN